MEPLSFFSRFVQKVVICFSNSFVQNKTQQSYRSSNATNDSQLLCKVFKKQPFIFCKNKHKINWAKSTALITTMPKCASYQIAEFTFCCWVTLKSCYRTKTHCVSQINTRTASIHCSSIDSMEISLRVVKCLKMCQDQSILIKETEEWTEIPASWKKDSWGRSKESIFWASSKGQNQRKSVYQPLQKEMNRLKRKYKLELLNVVHCFLDAYGSYSSNWVYLEIKSF